MSELAKFIATGKIPPEDLLKAQELIERAELVSKGIAACKQTIKFPIGVTEVDCYSYTDSAGEYESWGKCYQDGNFECWNNWGGNHRTGIVNLLDFTDVFIAFENEEFKYDLKRFLER